jgi:hypothetical protein
MQSESSLPGTNNKHIPTGSMWPIAKQFVKPENQTIDNKVMPFARNRGSAATPAARQKSHGAVSKIGVLSV